MDPDVRWFSMPIEEQLCNVGSEVNRAIRWKNRGDKTRSSNFCKKAIEFLRLTRKDPKNVHRIGELECAIDELADCFLGENLYQTSDEVLMRYYDAFMFRLVK